MTLCRFHSKICKSEKAAYWPFGSVRAVAIVRRRGIRTTSSQGMVYSAQAWSSRLSSEQRPATQHMTNMLAPKTF